jgi:hypothetical protein
MEKTDCDPFDAARSLTGSLKTKSRRRREDLKLLAASSPRVRATRNDLLPPLDLAYLLLEDLRMPVREVRKLDPVHVREVANSISTLGFCAPILVGKDNLVLDGAARVQAARLLDLGRAPCIRIEYLSEKEERVLRLAINRLGEKGEWNLDELKIEFEDLILADAPIEISGFTLDEIDQIVLGEVDDAVERGPLAPEPDAVAVARPAMFLRLGPTALSAAARPTLRPSSG